MHGETVEIKLTLRLILDET